MNIYEVDDKQTFDVIEPAELHGLVDLNEDPKKPPVAYRIGGEITGTFGNFTVIIGKAKSRKSFFVGGMVASMINGQWGNITGELPKDKNRILYFDTEQGLYHVLLQKNRIRDMSGKKFFDLFAMFKIKTFDTKERLSIVTQYIEGTKGVGLIVVDGIRDLITDINSPDQATEITGLLMKWAERLGVHIIVILHTNKTDNNARGHIGTELMNKSESMITIAKHDKNSDISIVEPEQTRNKPFEPFAFSIGEQGLPYILELPVEIRNKRSANDYVDLLDRIFNDQTLASNELAMRISVICKVGQTLARRFIVEFQELGKIIDENKAEGKGKTKQFKYVK